MLPFIFPVALIMSWLTGAVKSVSRVLAHVTACRVHFPATSPPCSRISSRSGGCGLQQRPLAPLQAQKSSVMLVYPATAGVCVVTGAVTEYMNVLFASGCSFIPMFCHNNELLCASSKYKQVPYGSLHHSILYFYASIE